MMNPRASVGILVAWSLVALVTAPGLLGQGIPQHEDLTIFFTGDGNAQILSCGCAVEDYGGVSRRAAFLDTLHASGWNMLTVDVGDISPFDGIDTQSRMKARAAARSMALMPYDAITLGEHDLAPGREYVADLIDWLGQPVVATNYHLSECESVRARVVQVGTRRVGVLGFLDETLAAVAPWLEVESWEDQQGLVDSIGAACDLLVALVHAPDTAAVYRLTDLYPGIQVVVSGHEGRHPAVMVPRGTTAVLGALAEGRYLGRAAVSFLPDGRPYQVNAAWLPVVKEWGRRDAVDRIVSGYAESVKRLALDDAFQAERLRRLQEPPVEYVGNEACVSCHTDEAEQWNTTLHAHAHETLVREEKDHDPDCQSCHTTGFGFRTGFATPEATPAMWNVGCESCHGPGADHVEDQEAPYGATSQETCAGCHTPHNSPGFDYGTYRPRIVHSAMRDPAGH